MNLKATTDHIIIEPNEAADRIGSIYVSDAHKERPQKGKVLSVGPGKWEYGIFVTTDWIKPGDEIIFGKYSGVEIEHEGKTVLIMRADDALVILNREETNEEKVKEAET